MSPWVELRIEQFGQAIRDAPGDILEAERLDERDVVPEARIQLVDDPATERPALVDQPQDWPWSTYGQVIGTRRRWPCFDPQRVIESFGSVRALRSYVETPRVSDTLKVSDTFKGV